MAHRAYPQEAPPACSAVSGIVLVLCIVVRAKRGAKVKPFSAPAINRAGPSPGERRKDRKGKRPDLAVNGPNRARASAGLCRPGYNANNGWTTFIFNLH